MSESRKGKRRSEETCKKMSDAQKGRVITKDHRRKLSESNKGRKVSLETRLKLSEAQKGHGFSEETLRKISKSNSATYYGFISPEGNSVVITNMKRFCIEHGLENANMYQLISGKRKQCKGWTYKIL